MLLIARGPQAQHATPFRRSRRSGGPNGDTALKPVVRCTLLPDHGCCQALPGEADQSRPKRRKPRRLKRLGRAEASGRTEFTPSCRAERGRWPRASSRKADGDVGAPSVWRRRGCTLGAPASPPAAAAGGQKNAPAKGRHLTSRSNARGRCNGASSRRTGCADRAPCPTLRAFTQQRAAASPSDTARKAP